MEKQSKVNNSPCILNAKWKTQYKYNSSKMTHGIAWYEIKYSIIILLLIPLILTLLTQGQGENLLAKINIWDVFYKTKCARI